MCTSSESSSDISAHGTGLTRAERTTCPSACASVLPNCGLQSPKASRGRAATKPWKLSRWTPLIVEVSTPKTSSATSTASSSEATSGMLAAALRAKCCHAEKSSSNSPPREATRVKAASRPGRLSCKMLWTSLSQSGKPCRSAMPDSTVRHKDSHLAWSPSLSPVSRTESYCELKLLGARTSVAAVITLGTSMRPSTLRMSAVTRSAGRICSIWSYLSSPQRPRHSRNSS
mmetsp:Transcript_18539/g.46108  ORF Transcript_18539/g.46108 Transcript_18539/m.46108 type:complete len:230 (+) Transcript_18539:290-979(+)